MFCSSLSTSTIVSLRSRQPEDALGDDVELDLAGPALDGVGFRAQPRPRGETVARALALPLERVRAARRHRQFHATLVEFGAVIFQQRGNRGMRLARFCHIA